MVSALKNKFQGSSRWLKLILILFALIFADISLVNHYLFRTTAWDLGIFNNALYDYAHFRWNISVVRIGAGPDMFPKNLLGDHFELYPVILSPFYYLFGSYTLLLAQIIAILFGGLGAYKYIENLTKDARLSCLASLHFFLMWGIYSALAFDYHNNVVAAMGIPWFLYYFEKGSFKKAWLFFFLIAIGKENMPLWLGFIGMALCIWNIKTRPKFWHALFFSLSGFASFIFLVKIIIPAFSPPGHPYSYNTFHALGNDFGEIAKTALQKPIYTFKLLFINHLHDPAGDGFKLATHVAVILSGGWAIFYRPKFLLMLIPIYGQKLFYDEITRWGVYCQYSIEWTPILCIALFTVLYSLFKDNPKWLYRTAIISIVLTALVTLQILETTRNRNSHCFYAAKHFKRTFDPARLYKNLELIPPNASLAASTVLVPHLSFRDTIYQVPHDNGSCQYHAYIASGEGPFEITKDSLTKIKEKYSGKINYKIIYFDTTLLIIKGTRKNISLSR